MKRNDDDNDNDDYNDDGSNQSYKVVEYISSTQNNTWGYPATNITTTNNLPIFIYIFNHF